MMMERKNSSRLHPNVRNDVSVSLWTSQGIRNNLISGSVIGICDLSKKIQAHLSNSCAGGYLCTKQRN